MAKLPTTNLSTSIVADALGVTKSDLKLEELFAEANLAGFDPAYAPGTGTPEPGGLDWFQVTALLRLVAAEKNVVAADVVEVMPVPGQVTTEFLAARLIYKLMTYVQMRE